MNGQSATEAAAADGFLQFLSQTPSPYHVTAELGTMLRRAIPNARELVPTAEWTLEAGGVYSYSQGGSFIAFALPPVTQRAAFVIWAAHSDSPVLKLKSTTALSKENCIVVLTEPYGGFNATSWFNRDLHLAGRCFITGDAEPKLIHLQSHRFTIPSAAVHFKHNRDHKSAIPNAEVELRAVLGLLPSTRPAANPKAAAANALQQLIAQTLQVTRKQLSSIELNFSPAEPPARLGLHHEFIAAAKLDNLAMTYSGMNAFIASVKAPLSLPHIPVFAIFDHEEVGSQSATGAASKQFLHTLERIILGYRPAAAARAEFLQALSRSFIISADMAHGVHPNYPNFHSEISKPLLGGGPVLKHNSQLRYMSDAHTERIAKEIAAQAKIPLQHFRTRGDLPTGSTIGPILASTTGVPTIDLGSPMLSMHNIREFMALSDHLAATQFATAFFTSPIATQAHT